MTDVLDPRVTTSDHLRTLRSLGFNRLSAGIQDFDWNVQLAVRRIQPYEHTRELFEQARILGFESINADEPSRAERVGGRDRRGPPPPVFRGYVQTKDDVIRGAVIEECLCSGRISKDDIERHFEICFDDYFTTELMRLNELERDGLLEGRESRTIRITPAGRIFVRAIAQVFDAFNSAAVASKAI